jgi:hypothetical protein
MRPSLLQSLSIFPDRATRRPKNPVCPEFLPAFRDAIRRCDRQHPPNPTASARPIVGSTVANGV